jgi:hypothetical protein
VREPGPDLRTAFQRELDRNMPEPGFVEGAAERVRRPAPRRRSGSPVATVAAAGLAVLTIGVLLAPRLGWLHRMPMTAGSQSASVPAAAPPARNGGAAAYDARNHQLVVFGGTDGPRQLADTWTWDGARWTQAHPAHDPPPGGPVAMAFDDARQQAVLVGPGGQTWTWDGQDWTRRHPAVLPPWPSGRLWPFVVSAVALVYDPALRLTVYVGPLGAETWTWDGAAWAAVRPAHEPNAPGVMAYSPRQQALVFWEPIAIQMNDYWTFDGRDWTTAGALPVPTGAQTNSFAAGVVAYDSGHEDWVVACRWAMTVPPLTSIVQRTGLTDLAQGLPVDRLDALVAYDVDRQRLLVFGGSALWNPRTQFANLPGVGQRLDDLWAWDGARWTRLA